MKYFKKTQAIPKMIRMRHVAASLRPGASARLKRRKFSRFIPALLCAALLVFCCPACAEGVPQARQQRLEQAEQKLATGREELAAQLRAYYMGQANEAETARLIRQVEEQRLLVESLRAESSTL